MNCTDTMTLLPIYISGELDRARAAELAAHLECCPACAQEMASQREMDTLLRAGVLADDVSAAEVDHWVRERIAPAPPRLLAVALRWQLVAAAIVTLLLIAGVAYRAFLTSKPASLYSDAARDHRSEVIFRQPRRWLVSEAAIEKLAEQRGVSPAAVASLAPTGYRPEHAKLCRLDGRIFLHLVYTDGTHEFSVFLRQRDSDAMPGKPLDTVNGRQLYRADFGDEHLGCFETDRLSAMVVTNQPGQAALTLARRAAAAL
jgi:anti-sigma factor RsiW